MAALVVSVCVLSACFYSVSSLPGYPPSQEVVRSGTPRPPSASGSYHVLPVFLPAAAPLVDAALFRPAGADGRLPSAVAPLLLPPPVASGALPGPASSTRNPRGVEVWCGHSTISVRVNRRTLGFRSPASMFHLGTCGVSRATKHYLYFHYHLSACGSARTVDGGRLVYSNTLRHAAEPRSRGAAVRALPTSLRLQCLYDRFHYTYKVGYVPEVQKNTVLKSLRSKRRFTLAAYNARWEKLPPGRGYLLGQPMYFEARTAFLAKSQRLFVNSCYVSPSKESNSEPRMEVVKNFGCMADSKRRRSRSKFLSSKTNALRFTVDAFVFPKISAKYLYLHCSLTVGDYAPTPVSKSCSFNRRQKRWEELYGPSSVCSCCDSVCEAEESEIDDLPSTESALSISGPWMVINTDQNVVVVPVSGEKSVEIAEVPPVVGQSEEVLEDREPSVWQEDSQEEEMENDKE
ncbi:hypothetical protein GN956_G4400 [Arapaima gigas]